MKELQFSASPAHAVVFPSDCRFPLKEKVERESAQSVTKHFYNIQDITLFFLEMMEQHDFREK